MSALQICTVVLAIAACSLSEGPMYLLEDNISGRLTETNMAFQIANNLSANAPFDFSDEENFEWEPYDGWFNNPAHVNWGGYGKQ